MKPDSDSGIIHPPIDVGTADTCPPRRGCPGQGWETAAYCSIFGQELERVSGTGRKHLYRKCAPCLAALKEPDRAVIPRVRHSVGIDIVRDE